MNSISPRDRVILVIVASIALIAAAINYVLSPLYDLRVEKEQQKQTLQNTVSDIGPIRTELESLKKENDLLLEAINAYKEKTPVKGLSKQEILVYLSQSARINDVDIIRFKFMDGIEESNGVWRVRFNYELRGTIENLNRVNQTMHNIGLQYSVGSMSYRQNRNYPYLVRSFDDGAIFEWYQNYTEEQRAQLEKSPANSQASPPPFTDNTMRLDVVLEYVMYINPDTALETEIDTGYNNTPAATLPPSPSPNPSPSTSPSASPRTSSATGTSGASTSGSTATNPPNTDTEVPQQ